MTRIKILARDPNMAGEKKEESRISAFLGTKNVGRGAVWGKLVSFFARISVGVQWLAGYEGLESTKGV